MNADTRQGYAWEITTSEGGWGLDQVLKSRQHVLDGIANGIDMDEWDPATDSHLAQNYSAANLAGVTPYHSSTCIPLRTLPLNQASLRGPSERRDPAIDG